ncbi:MAG: ATP-binding protein [Bacteroidota bacterium]|nr:ATP-binding protein [Bacteroidota bacterium]
MLHRRILLILVMVILSVSQARPQTVDSLMALRDTTILSEDQIELQLQIADILSESDIRAALDYANHALTEAEEISSVRWIAEAKLAIGKYYDFLGVNQIATEYLMDALSSFEDLNDSAKQASTLMHIGNTYFYIKQFETALKKFSLVSEYGRALNDTSLIISGLNATAAVYGNISKMDSALILFKEAHALARQYGSLQQEILAYYNMGDVHLYSGRRTQALEVFQDLENYYDLKTNGPKHLSSLYNSMTKAYLEKRNLPLAKEYSEKALLALQDNMRLIEYPEYYLHLFRIDSLEQKYEDALAHYIRYKDLNDSLINASFKENLANREIYYELRSKQNQIERLTLDNQFKDLKIRQKRLTNYGYTVLSVLMLTIVFLVIRSYRKIKEKNLLLEKQKEDLKAAQQRLVQSEKMASIGTLTAGIAHEINNPLNFISGGLNIIKDLQDTHDWEGREKDRKRCMTATKMAFDGLDRSIGIVQALMTFSHRGGSSKTESDLHEIIDNTLMFLGSKISDDIQIVKNYKLERQVPIFPEKMHQVIMNILDNAIYAVNRDASRPKVIRISTGISGDKLKLSFSNTGPSIAEEHLDQLFDPFFTTKDPGQGTGLGLSICYTLVSEHGGEIEAGNTREGVNFTVTIPLK